MNKPIAPSSGASATSVLTNLASVQNTGIEAVLTTTLVDRRRFGWDMTISASHGSNKILKVYGPNGYCSSTITTACDSVGTGTTRNIKGKPVNGSVLRAVHLRRLELRRHHHAERSDRRNAESGWHARPDDGRVHGLFESA